VAETGCQGATVTVGSRKDGLVTRLALRTTVAPALAAVRGAVAARRHSRLGRAIDRTAVVIALGSAAVMVFAVFGPWVSEGGPWRGGLARVHDVGYNGWMFLVAGLAGGVLTVLAARSQVSRVWVLAAGALGAASAFQVLENIDDRQCLPAPANTLWFFCASPSAGWGLYLARIASLALLCAGAVLVSVTLSFSFPRRLPQWPRRRSLPTFRKYSS
jgi:hypothetical protein